MKPPPTACHDPDVIVHATGFHGTSFLWPIEVRGRSGSTPAELAGADGDIRAYLGTALVDFPTSRPCSGRTQASEAALSMWPSARPITCQLAWPWSIRGSGSWRSAPRSGLAQRSARRRHSDDCVVRSPRGQPLPQRSPAGSSPPPPDPAAILGSHPQAELSPQPPGAVISPIAARPACLVRAGRAASCPGTRCGRARVAGARG